MRNVVQCVRDAGFNIEGPFPDDNDPNFYYYQTSAAEGEQDRLTDQAVGECEATYLQFIEYGWIDANTDPDEAQDTELYELTIDCLEGRSGDDLSEYDPASTSDLNRLIDSYGDQYLQCIEEAGKVMSGSS